MRTIKRDGECNCKRPNVRHYCIPNLPVLTSDATGLRIEVAHELVRDIRDNGGADPLPRVHGAVHPDAFVVATAIGDLEELEIVYLSDSFPLA